MYDYELSTIQTVIVLIVTIALAGLFGLFIFGLLSSSVEDTDEENIEIVYELSTGSGSGMSYITNEGMVYEPYCVVNDKSFSEIIDGYVGYYEYIYDSEDKEEYSTIRTKVYALLGHSPNEWIVTKINELNMGIVWREKNITSGLQGYDKEFGTRTISINNGIEFEYIVDKEKGLVTLHTHDRVYEPYCREDITITKRDGCIGYYNYLSDDYAFYIMIDIYKILGYSTSDWIVSCNHDGTNGIIWKEVNAKSELIEYSPEFGDILLNVEATESVE